MWFALAHILHATLCVAESSHSMAFFRFADQQIDINTPARNWWSRGYCFMYPSSAHRSRFPPHTIVRLQRHEGRACDLRVNCHNSEMNTVVQATVEMHDIAFKEAGESAMDSVSQTDCIGYNVCRASPNTVVWERVQRCPESGGWNGLVIFCSSIPLKILDLCAQVNRKLYTQMWCVRTAPYRTKFIKDVHSCIHA